MWLLKLNLLLLLLSFSKQETENNNNTIFIQTSKNIDKQTVTLWCNVSFNDQELLTQVQWIESNYLFKPDHVAYLNSFSPKRVDIASFLKFPKDEECGGKMYTCKIHKGYFVFKKLNRSIYVDKCPPNNDLPIIRYFPDPYVLKYWVKTLVVEEGTNIILKCVYDEQQFPNYKTWYKGENEMVKFNEQVHLNFDNNNNNNVLSIKNLNLNDTNVYRCVSPENEFSTNVVVVRSHKQKPRKKIINQNKY